MKKKQLENELTLVKKQLEDLKQEHTILEDMKEKSDYAIKKLQEKVDYREKKTQALIGSLRYLIQYSDLPDSEYKNLYSQVYTFLDKEGFNLYRTAKEISGIDIYSCFSTEDMLGYFEEANGFSLFEWLIKAKFGEIEWEQLECGPYEMASYVSYKGKETAIAEFKLRVYRLTVCRLFGISMDEENVKNDVAV